MLLPRRVRRLSLAALVALAVLVAAARLWQPALPPTDPAVLAALASVAIPLVTDDPSADEAELQALLQVLGNRRVVALGEATHGTREFFRLKDRLLRLLVRRRGFTTFALEISPEGAARVDRYVRDGGGNLDDALRQFEFWTWQTEEVRELAQWLREWNAGVPGERRVSFVGINATGPDRDARMAANVLTALDAAGPDGRLVVWAHNGHVAKSGDAMGRYLRDRLGDALYVVGFEFSEGSFRSRNLRGIRQHAVSAAGPEYFAFELSRLGAPIVFLDFATAARQPVLAGWLSTPRRSRDIDELFYLTQFSERWHSRLEPWPQLYDGVIFVRSSTPARGLFASPSSAPGR